MTPSESPERFHYANDKPAHTHAYLLDPLMRAVDASGARTILDLGCGNGWFTRELLRRGLDAYGCDTSSSGIERAREHHPERFRVASAYDDLRAVFDKPQGYDALVSVEVVEHVFSPSEFATRAFGAIRPGGSLILTTPYHGYWKNLALAVTGKFDDHFTALWEGGHIKFWSKKTLSTLLTGAGFVDISMSGAGRLPYLWKAMVMRARKPR